MLCAALLLGRIDQQHSLLAVECQQYVQTLS